MSKGLKALQRSFDSWKYLKDYETIEKELKALEIIIKKLVDIKWLNECDELEDYNWINQLTLEQEEYNLLKECLRNDN